MKNRNNIPPVNYIAYILLHLFFAFLIINPGYSQRKDAVTKDTQAKEGIPDYEIINSNESFIELEFIPQYISDTDFKGSSSNSSKYGSPDVKLRSFPVFLPGSSEIRLEIVDAKYDEVQNTEVLPVPILKRSKDKDGVDQIYSRDEKIYNSNSFYPGEPAYTEYLGIMRNKYFGNLSLYPVQYNPAANTVRKYSYIRVRINFTSSPVYSSKSLSKEEKTFLENAAINSVAASNWSTNEFNNQTDSGIENSVLASGDFYKMEVRETGMYRLNKNFFQGTGINIGSIDPRTIKIYGNGGAELPYDNSVASPNDLVENSIYVFGEEDGQFNDNDYILFFGRSPNDWTYDTDSKTYRHVINHYSKVNYYWITFGGSTGLRMIADNSPNLPGLNPVPFFKERIFEEPELNNLGSTGLLWVSQRISVNESFTFNKELTGYVGGSNVNLRFRFGNGSFFDETWRLEDFSSGFLTNRFASRLFDGFSHINLINISEGVNGVSYPLSAGRTNVNFKASLRSIDGNSPNVSGYYDYLEVLYDRSFASDNNVLRFNTPDTNGTLEFNVNNFNTLDVKLFDVTRQESVGIVNPISNANGTVKFQSNLVKGIPKEYIAVGNNYKTPSSISARIPNQNLKGDLYAGSSFFIIAPKEFLSAANRLKSQREKPGSNYLKTEVIDAEKIFNEFSGGLQDPVAMRNFLKYAFTNFQERPVYVLFFGDGSYDYKNIYNLPGKNWILPIEKNSEYANDVDSYCSDDFIVEINENYPAPGGITITDFSSGRLPANSLEDANILVDKVISYEDPANFDKWRNNNFYVADDGWTTENTGGQEGSIHTDQCEDVAENHTPNFVKKNKVYIVSYPTEFTPQGRRKPAANSDIIKNWNDGKLVINYTGHGSTDLWAHEHIFERQVSIPQLTNKNKYTFLTIASCDLARWDDPFNTSAAEQLMTIKDKGAIGVVAAVRPVYSVPNAIFNNELYDNLFKSDTLGLRLRVGKAMFNVKQNRFYENDLKFALICDPTLRLGLPQHRTRIDSMNSTSGNDQFEMKSLQKVRIYGSVLTPDSSFWSDYNGKIDLQVYDVDKHITYVDFNYTFNYKILGGIIYTGKANIVNGRWSVEFVVPKDISYNTGRGKLLAYFNNETSDGLGFSNNFTMNGTDTTAAADSTGPVVDIFLGSRNFRNGDLVNQNPKLIADFSDENGINLTGTIGHKIEAIMNEDENNKIDLTPFYNTNQNYQSGTVEYQMENLPDGHYKLEVKAWDTYNNTSSKIVEFDVKSNSSLALEGVYNYPNPMQDQTNFVFEHNQDEPMSVTINIYTVAGRLIKELNKNNITDKFVSLQWDGKDSDGDYIANGTYLYKLILESEDGSFSSSTLGKLAKLK